MNKWREQFMTEAERTKTNKPEMKWHRRDVFKWKIAAFEHKASKLARVRLVLRMSSILHNAQISI